VYNIQKAVSRLDYAPELKEIAITDIKKGLGVFTPKPDKLVSFAALKNALRKAGYALDAADITVVGTLVRDAQGGWWINAASSGQRFALAGTALETVLAGAAVDSRVEMTGDWKTVGEKATAREIISPREVKKASDSTGAKIVGKIVGEMSENLLREESVVEFERANFVVPPISASPSVPEAQASKSLAPIRVTSPGLTVYRGGAFTPRLYFIRQHLGELEVRRQVLDLSVSYTPTPRLQLEVEVPISRTAFDDGQKSGAGVGLGNITLWSKYRFYRTVKTYGDRQAAARFGLELPTGRNEAPNEREVNAPAFVREQLTPVNGGLTPHFDLAFSQAGGRFIFGGNVEGILRTERGDFRLGHELRVNTDLEYVLLPFKYDSPGKELFVILETSFIQRGAGRLSGASVPGSGATEYYIAPGLQYAANPRFVVESSLQIPLVRNTGPLSLRTDSNLLLGIRYLF